jgi:hypothetical protein
MLDLQYSKESGYCLEFYAATRSRVNESSALCSEGN